MAHTIKDEHRYDGREATHTIPERTPKLPADVTDDERGHILYLLEKLEREAAPRGIRWV